MSFRIYFGIPAKTNRHSERSEESLQRQTVIASREQRETTWQSIKQEFLKRSTSFRIANLHSAEQNN